VLSYQDLEELPADIAQLINLEDLRLNGNRLTRLPPEIGKMVGPHLIDVSHNKLTSLPPEVGNLTDTSLRATNNRITKLPDEIVHVKSVDLSGNPIPAEEQERIRGMLSPARSGAVKF